MRFFLSGLLLFSFQVLVNAQDIFIPFEGQKEIIKINDINLKDTSTEDGYIDRLGDECGDYFFYQEIRDQKIISFKIRDESDSAVTFPIERIGKSLLIIKPDDSAEVPIARWYSSDEGILMIIRISSKDYKEATCLPEPNQELLDLIK